MLRTLLLAPIFALAFAACTTETVVVEVTPTPDRIQDGADSSPTPKPEGTAAQPAASQPAAASPTKAPAATVANEAARGTATVAAQGLAATAAPTQPPAPAATPVPPTNTPVPKPTATPVPPTPVPPTPTAKPAANCHASYPTVCIPPPPPDLDCGDIPYRRFTVVGADPHRFDADKDGVGCES